MDASFTKSDNNKELLILPTQFLMMAASSSQISSIVVPKEKSVHDLPIAVDMTGIWNPLSVLDKRTPPAALPAQKSFSDTDLVAADMTCYNDPVRAITSPLMNRATTSFEISRSDKKSASTNGAF